MRRVVAGFWLLVVWIAAAATTVAAAVESSGYRLAGVIDLGQRMLAMLELPDHHQVTVETGDVVGDVTVAAVEHRSVTLDIGGERVVLTLAGAEGPGTEATGADTLQVVARNVSAAALDRLDDLRSSPLGTEEEMLAALNEALGLPILTQPSPADAGNARTPAIPVRVLVGRLYDRLATGQPVKLYLESSSADEIYLLPET